MSNDGSETIDQEIEEASEDAPAAESDRRKYLAGLFLLLLGDTKAQLTALVTAYLSGSLTIYRLQAKVSSLLIDAHAHAAYLGRQLAGIRHPFGRSDQSFASTVMFRQVQYLENLLNDLENGRYPLTDAGEIGGALKQRLTLYANGLRTTADSAWVKSLDPGALITWTTTAAESCGCCLDMEAGSPYKASELTTFPGECDCLGNCRCVLSQENGDRGFELD